MTERFELVIEDPIELCGFGRGTLGYAALTLPLNRKLTILPGRYTVGRPVINEPTDPNWGDEALETEFAVILESVHGNEIASVRRRMLLESMVGIYTMNDWDTERLQVRGYNFEFLGPDGGDWQLFFWLTWEHYEFGFERALFTAPTPQQTAIYRSVHVTCTTASDQDLPCTSHGFAYTGGAGIQFHDCTFPWEPVRRIRITFDRGFIEVDQQVTGLGRAATAYPQIILSAHGELDGVPFEQRDPLRLGLMLPHLGFDLLSFAVGFPAPIVGTTCGIGTEFTLEDEQRIYGFDCDLAEVEQYELLEITSDLIPFEER